MIKLNSCFFKVSIFSLVTLFMLFIFSVFPKHNISAYGETIEGYQTHYEIQNQYISGGYLYIEGFYFVLYLQNYTDSTKDSGTHYYSIQINNGLKTYTYYDTGNYYVDLTLIEKKDGAPWASVGESDIVMPMQTNKNYRYKDVGFQFRIPVSDLGDFMGPECKWNVNVSCVALNTYKGRYVKYEFRQSKIYASKKFGETLSGDYKISAVTSLETTSSIISADVAFVRTSPGKDASNSNRAIYKGAFLFWGTGQRFYDLSVNTTVSSGYDKLTWYRLSYGNIYYDGRYRAAYQSGSGNFGWIPSVFLGSVSGTAYSIKVVNIPPVIQANDKSFNEGTVITKEILLENVSAYDYSFGTKKPEIIFTDLVLDSSGNKTSTYNVTYRSTDLKNVSTDKKIKVTIVNVPPVIQMENEARFDYGEILTIEDLMSHIITAYDVYDGDLISKVYIKDYGGLIIGRDDNPYNYYNVVFGVKDSNGAESTAILKFKISYRFIRAVSDEYLYTLSDKSKWNEIELKNSLKEILERNPSQKYEREWVF